VTNAWNKNNLQVKETGQWRGYWLFSCFYFF